MSEPRRLRVTILNGDGDADRPMMCTLRDAETGEVLRHVISLVLFAHVRGRQVGVRLRCYAENGEGELEVNPETGELDQVDLEAELDALDLECWTVPRE